MKASHTPGMSGRAVGRIYGDRFLSCWVLRYLKHCMVGEFDIYWKRSVVFQSSLKKKKRRKLWGGRGGGGRSLFPLLSANSLQVPHFSTEAVKAQFNRDNGEKAGGFSTSQLRGQTVSSPGSKHGVWSFSTWLICLLSCYHLVQFTRHQPDSKEPNILSLNHEEKTWESHIHFATNVM